MRLASLLSLLRARRSFCDVERRSRNPMSSLGQRRWWYDNRSLASWLSLDADCQLALSAGAMIFADLISAKCARVCDALQPCHSLYASTVTDFFDFSRTSGVLGAIAIRTLKPAGHSTSKARTSATSPSTTVKLDPGISSTRVRARYARTSLESSSSTKSNPGHRAISTLSAG